VGAFAKNLRYALRRKTKWLFADWVFSIPPAGVVTRLAVYLILSGILAGCGPAGPRAVLDGKKYLDRGEYQQAIEELRSATELLPTNALAYSYLGLAFHSAGQPAEAERAYQRALALDHDLTEVHYNLGCLWLTQSNRIDQAKSELTAYTMRRPNSTEGWVGRG
jgi:tetratricopeptide (TPR) repeat protein